MIQMLRNKWVPEVVAMGGCQQAHSPDKDLVRVNKENPQMDKASPEEINSIHLTTSTDLPMFLFQTA
jgi:hypothetical protein